MIDSLLALLGIGQAQSHRSADRLAVASSHLANVEKICLETGVRLAYEIDRLGRLAECREVPFEIALGPLINLHRQNEEVKALAETNRDLLNEKGANAQVVAELERWSETCQVIPTQVDLTVRQLEEKLSNC